MSNDTNTKLLEEAAFFIDYFQDTTIGRVLEADVERGDYDILRDHVEQARVQAAMQEYSPEMT